MGAIKTFVLPAVLLVGCFVFLTLWRNAALKADDARQDTASVQSRLNDTQNRLDNALAQLKVARGE